MMGPLTEPVHRGRLDCHTGPFQHEQVNTFNSPVHLHPELDNCCCPLRSHSYHTPRPHTGQCPPPTPYPLPPPHTHPLSTLCLYYHSLSHSNVAICLQCSLPTRRGLLEGTTGPCNFTHSLFHSFIHSLIHSFTGSSTHTFIYFNLFTHSFLNIHRPPSVCQAVVPCRW